MTPTSSSTPSETDPGLADWMVTMVAQSGRIPSPHSASSGPIEGERGADWTDRLIRAGSYGGIFRQCSIGWHDECSQRDQGPDAECRCECHGGT